MGGSGSSGFSGLGSLFSALAPIVSLTIDVLKALAKAIEAFAKEMGIIEADENIEELGDKALQCDMQPEDFDEFDEYLDYVRKVELDPEKSESFSEVEKLAAGSLILTNGIEEKAGIKMGDFLLNIASKDPQSFNAENLKNYIDVFSDAGVDLDRISDLESGKISDLDEKKEIYDLIDKANLS